MISDILNKTFKIDIEGETFTLDYDNRAYAMLEERTGKGLMKLYDEFVIKNNSSYEDCINIACCGLLKNHGESEIEKVYCTLNEKRYLFIKNIAQITMAFVQPLTPPEIMSKQESASKNLKKRTNR